MSDSSTLSTERPEIFLLFFEQHRQRYSESLFFFCSLNSIDNVVRGILDGSLIAMRLYFVFFDAVSNRKISKIRGCVIFE